MNNLLEDFKKFIQPQGIKAREDQRKHTKEQSEEYSREWRKQSEKEEELHKLLFTIAGGTLSIFAALSIDKSVSLWTIFGFLAFGLSMVVHIIREVLNSIFNMFFLSLTQTSDYKFQKSQFKFLQDNYGIDVQHDLHMIDSSAPDALRLREKYGSINKAVNWVGHKIPLLPFIVLHGQIALFVGGIIMICAGLFTHVPPATR